MLTDAQQLEAARNYLIRNEGVYKLRATRTDEELSQATARVVSWSLFELYEFLSDPCTHRSISSEWV